MSVAELPIPIDREKIAAFCRARGIARLELFGSALQDDFRNDSDVDLLCSLRPGVQCGLFEWAALKIELEKVLDRRWTWSAGGELSAAKTATANTRSFRRRCRFMKRDTACLEDVLQPAKGIPRGLRNAKTCRIFER